MSMWQKIYELTTMQISINVLLHFRLLSGYEFGYDCDFCLLIFIHQEVSGMPTSLKRESSQTAVSPDVMGESSSSGTARLDKADSFRGTMDYSLKQTQLQVRLSVGYLGHLVLLAFLSRCLFIYLPFLCMGFCALSLILTNAMWLKRQFIIFLDYIYSKCLGITYHFQVVVAIVPILNLRPSLWLS